MNLAVSVGRKHPLLLLLGFFSLLFSLLFLPVTLRGYATSGDGTTQAIPTFFGRNPLWEPNIMLGYPLFADPNAAYWYPLLRLLRLIPHSFNVYVIAPYVIASFGLAAFARRVTGGSLAGVVAGTTFALSGFMIAHQGHLNLIHPAAWSMLVLWAIEERRQNASMRPVLGGSIALAIAATSGSQQALVYVLAVGVAYAFVMRPTSRDQSITYLRDVTAMIVLGTCVAAVALVPEIELTRYSIRAHQTVAEFAQFGVRPLEFPLRTFFPFFFGATPSSHYPYSHENVGAFSEVTSFVGILPLMLSLLAIRSSPERRQVWFWSAVAIWAIWMECGSELLGARVAYYLPIYGLFRIPGRHVLEWTLAISMLSAIGFRLVEQRVLHRRDQLVNVAIIVAVFSASGILVFLFGDALRTAIGAGVGIVALTPVPTSPWKNAAIGIPVVDLAVCGCVFLSLALLRSLFWRRTLCLAVLLFDLLTFAGFSYWRYSYTATSVVVPPPRVVMLRSYVDRLGGRSLIYGDPEIKPNLSALWLLPSVSGYVSLELAEIAALLRIDATGSIAANNFGDASDASLDLGGVRYLQMPFTGRSARARDEFARPALHAFIGADRFTPQKSVIFGLEQPFRASRLDLVSALGVSMSVRDATTVAELVVDDVAHHRFILPVRAGRETSESAFDRSDIRPLMKHRKIQVFSSAAGVNLYIARIVVPTHDAITRLSIRWRPEIAAAMTIAHVALVDKATSMTYDFADVDTFYADHDHWHLHRVGSALAIEDTQAVPRAWIVQSARKLAMSDELHAIHYGVDDGQKAFNPKAQALLTDTSFQGAPRSHSAITESDVSSPTWLHFVTTCSSKCMLVDDDLFYPGWQATVDGRRVQIDRVDTALRGVMLGVGSHVVDEWFAPRSLFLGALISLVACVVLITLVAQRSLRRVFNLE